MIKCVAGLVTLSAPVPWSLVGYIADIVGVETLRSAKLMVDGA